MQLTSLTPPADASSFEDKSGPSIRQVRHLFALVASIGLIWFVHCKRSRDFVIAKCRSDSMVIPVPGCDKVFADLKC